MESKKKPTGKSLSDESVQRRTELFEKYILPHKNLVYRICIQYTFNQDDIEDNYTEALVNFYKYIDSYDASRPLKTWIYAVCQRFVYDQNRRRSNIKKNDNVDVENIGHSMLHDDEVSENCLGMDNYREFYNDEILAALDSLKPIYKEVILLQMAGYRLQEIVEITHRNGSLRSPNIETIKSRLFLAKQAMRNLITRDGERRED